MSLDHLLTTPCELVQRAYAETPADDGAQPAAETVIATTLCELQQASSLEAEGGAVQIATYRVFLPAGAPLRGWDAIRLTDSGELLELEGDAAAPRSPLTGITHVEAMARRTDYGEAAA